MEKFGFQPVSFKAWSEADKCSMTKFVEGMDYTVFESRFFKLGTGGGIEQTVGVFFSVGDIVRVKKIFECHDEFLVNSAAIESAYSRGGYKQPDYSMIPKNTLTIIQKQGSPFDFIVKNPSLNQFLE